MVKVVYKYDEIKRDVKEFLDSSEANWHDAVYIMDWEERLILAKELYEAITDLYMNAIRHELKGNIHPGDVVEYLSLKEFVKATIEEIQDMRWTY